MFTSSRGVALIVSSTLLIFSSQSLANDALLGLRVAELERRVAKME